MTGVSFVGIHNDPNYSFLNDKNTFAVIWVTPKYTVWYNGINITEIDLKSTMARTNYIW